MTVLAVEAAAWLCVVREWRVMRLMRVMRGMLAVRDLTVQSGAERCRAGLCGGGRGMTCDGYVWRGCGDGRGVWIAGDAVIGWCGGRDGGGDVTMRERGDGSRW